MRTGALTTTLLLLVACDGGEDDSATPLSNDHGPIAEGISGMLGDPIPTATEEQLETFARGHEVALKRFDRADGLGPGFNVSFCVACHEKPVIGGAAGLYRNFFLHGRELEDGTFFFGNSAGNSSGVVRMNYYGTEYDPRPAIPETDNVFTQRNPVPFFGVGLIAELPDDEILEWEDPDDADGDGISGRANYDRGFVGRFGMKSQTVSIEGFIRGPLNNHAGITTDPLSEEQRANLPVDSSQGSAASLDRFLPGLRPEWSPFQDLHGLAQAAAPDGPLTDNDDVADPEMSTDELFDLVSFSMLLAAPEFEPLNETTTLGRDLFNAAGCGSCHRPRLDGPRGPIPAYSDFLLHDMGEDLTDGIVMGYASKTEFRTMPLWGVAAEGPYLHDGRATTLDEAILWHGGEAEAARDYYAGLTQAEKDAVVEFLLSLGGRSQATGGLLLPDQPVPDAEEYGGPYRVLDEAEMEAFVAGRAVFDREFGLRDGVGNPRYNGDSCRACHFDPVIGGAGPRDLNVMRHAILNEEGEYVVPYIGTVLHREIALFGVAIEPQAEVNVFESRNTPHLFGVGLIEAIPDATILAAEDPYDLDGDGISGKASWVDGGRLGRFGWKAQVPTIEEFVRDAVATELGMTMPLVDGLTFGRIYDNDEVADPEYDLNDAELLEGYLRMLAGPPRQPSVDAAAEAQGEALFDSLGCDSCHTPVLEGDLGPVPLYSDLLLHEILPDGSEGIEDASATVTEFRTAPLWGLSQTAPYFHTGEADTIADAIELHDGEAAAIRDAWRALTPEEQAALLAFLETL